MQGILMLDFLNLKNIISETVIHVCLALIRCNYIFLRLGVG